MRGWYLKQMEDIWFFQCKIESYFTEWTPKAVLPFMKIQVLVFMSEMEFILHWKNQIFCFFYAFIKFIYNNYASTYSLTLMSEN